MGSALSKKSHISQTAQTKLAVTATFLTLRDQSRENTPSVVEARRADDSSETYDDESLLNLTQERRQTRKDIFEFLETSKKDKEFVDTNTDASIKFVSKYDEDEPSHVMADNSVYVIPEKVDTSHICSICNKATKFMEDGFPCRVCSDVYHQKCLKESPYNYTDRELKIMERARTQVGWSCDKCDNLCNLLSAEEFQAISDDFEKLDVNKDADITLEEFIDFQKKEHEMLFEKPMDDFEEDLLQFQFNMLDVDKSGSINYSEFIKHQATKILGRKDKHSLVKLLSPNEIRAAKTMFDLLDANQDGTVSKNEARNAYRSFYTTLETINKHNSLVKKPDATGMLKPDIETKQIASHVSLKADIVMEADENDDCFVDWKEFLRGQALSIISSRINKYGIPNE